MITLKKLNGLIASLAIFFILLNTAHTETLITPATFEKLWVSDNRSRIVRSYMRMSDQQLIMSRRDIKSQPFLFNLSLESGAEKVTFPTNEGIRQGTIDGNSIHIASAYFSIFLEQMILNEDGEGTGKSKFTFSDYIVTGSFPVDNGIVSLGVTKSKKPITDNGTFSIVRTLNELEVDNIGAFFHINYNRFQFGSYVDGYNAKSLYALVNFDFNDSWHNDVFLTFDNTVNNESDERSIQFKTAMDVSVNTIIGLSMKYDLAINDINSSGIHLSMGNINIDYQKYYNQVVPELEDRGYNFEIFWGNRDSASIGLGYRINYKDHQGYYVNDYPIISFFIRATI